MAKLPHEDAFVYWNRLRAETRQLGLLEQAGCGPEQLAAAGYSSPWTFLIDHHSYAPMARFLALLSQHFAPEDARYLLDRLVREYTGYADWQTFYDAVEAYPNWRPSQETLDTFQQRGVNWVGVPCTADHLHEAQDRCQTVLLLLNDLLRGHPGVEKAGVGPEVDKAINALNFAYQQIGQVDMAG